MEREERRFRRRRGQREVKHSEREENRRKTTTKTATKRFSLSLKKKKGEKILTLQRRLRLDALDILDRVRKLLRGRVVGVGKGDVL